MPLFCVNSSIKVMLDFRIFKIFMKRPVSRLISCKKWIVFFQSSDHPLRKKFTCMIMKIYHSMIFCFFFYQILFKSHQKITLFIRPVSLLTPTIVISIFLIVSFLMHAVKCEISTCDSLSSVVGIFVYTLTQILYLFLIELKENPR